MFKYSQLRFKQEKLIRKVRELNPKQFLLILLLVLLVSTAVSYSRAQNEPENSGGETEFEAGESHCALGGLGLLLLTASLAAGFLVSGRFGRIAGLKPLPAHKLAVIVMALYLTGEFIYGSTVGSALFVNSLHGALGFSTAALAWLTVALNPLSLTRVARFKKASRIHLVLATSLFMLLTIHLLYAFTLFGE